MDNVSRSQNGLIFCVNSNVSILDPQSSEVNVTSATIAKNVFNRLVPYNQEKNQFREAAEIFAELENYKDSPQRFKRCNRMIKGNKVRAVGQEHTKAAWVNVFLSAFMALACMISAPTHIMINFLWGVPLIIFSVVMTIIRARYRPAKRMWIVMAVVSGLFIVLTVSGILPFGPGANSIPSLIYLAMTMGLIFI